MAHQYVPKIFHDPHKNPPAFPLLHMVPNVECCTVDVFMIVTFVDYHK